MSSALSGSMLAGPGGSADSAACADLSASSTTRPIRQRPLLCSSMQHSCCAAGWWVCLTQIPACAARAVICTAAHATRRSHVQNWERVEALLCMTSQCMCHHAAYRLAGRLQGLSGCTSLSALTKSRLLLARACQHSEGPAWMACAAVQTHAFLH